jgi:hypothetical protein
MVGVFFGAIGEGQSDPRSAQGPMITGAASPLRAVLA